MHAGAAPSPADGEPAWEASLLLLAARVTALAGLTRLVHLATPLNWDEELLALVSARRKNGRLEPRFIYKPCALPLSVVEELDRVASALAFAPGISGLIGARAAEALLEAELALSVGTRAFPVLARGRFRSSVADDARADRWAKTSVVDSLKAPDLVLSDDLSDPRSLLASMQRAVGERRLGVRVIAKPGLAALAATGEGVVFVAAGRLLSPRAAERTVIHEIAGHVEPAERRRRTGMAFRPAGDSDDEEGRALAQEHLAGYLDPQRRKELGLRHTAARLAHDSAPFHEIVEALERLGAPPGQAIQLAARASRGGGLGRERVYLPALWRC